MTRQKGRGVTTLSLMKILKLFLEASLIPLRLLLELAIPPSVFLIPTTSSSAIHPTHSPRQHSRTGHFP
jgi:hypothetical protein